MALPVGQKLAGAAGYEETHLVPQLELPGLRWVVVGLLLFPLGWRHLFLHDGCYLLNPGL